MIIYPALDILNGQVVRLEKGDFSKVTDFKPPIEDWFEKFESMNVKALHMVDLSGARDPGSRQTEVLRSLKKNRSFKIQVGGGVRSWQDIQSLFQAGADRVVLGSLIFSDPKLVIEAGKYWGNNKFTLAFDVQNQNGTFEVLTQAWAFSSGYELLESLEFCKTNGFQRILCTDVLRDGMMLGPNLELYKMIRSGFPELEVQASGGVSGLADLKALQQLDVHSVIVGRGFLSGKISLQEAMTLC
jgi:phosphoribosylformimino-5-aminoimidazole carboxamide ribotide isomerase